MEAAHPLPPRFPPAYRVERTYQWNYDHGPQVDAALLARKPAAVPGTPSLCGNRLNSPLGVAAGPLLNSRWVAAYARLGFDFLTYKTVRTHSRPCYAMPNWVFVEARELGREDVCGGALCEISDQEAIAHGAGLSTAVSFGMPSQPPEVWQADVRAARDALGEGQALVVSVVGTPDARGDREALADDFAAAAAMAAEAGAHVVEANLSCPNVTSAEGAIFTDPTFSARIARRCADAIGRVPLLLKVGFLPDDASLAGLLHAVSGIAAGIVTLNTVTTNIVRKDGSPAFGEPSRLHAGVTGRAILPAAVGEVRRATEIIRRDDLTLEVVAVGGVGTPADVAVFFDAGATVVEMATAAVFQPDIAFRVRETMAGN